MDAWSHLIRDLMGDRAATVNGTAPDSSETLDAALVALTRAKACAGTLESALAACAVQMARCGDGEGSAHMRRLLESLARVRSEVEQEWCAYAEAAEDAGP